LILHSKRDGRIIYIYLLSFRSRRYARDERDESVLRRSSRLLSEEDIMQEEEGTAATRSAVTAATAIDDDDDDEDPWGAFGSDDDDDDDEDPSSAATAATNAGHQQEPENATASSSDNTTVSIFGQALAAKLTQLCLRSDSRIPLEQRRIGVIEAVVSAAGTKEARQDDSRMTQMEQVRGALESRGFQVVELREDDGDGDERLQRNCALVDAMVVVVVAVPAAKETAMASSDDLAAARKIATRRVVPGGNLLLLLTERECVGSPRRNGDDAPICDDSTWDPVVWETVALDEKVADGSRAFAMTHFRRRGCRAQSNKVCPWLPSSRSLCFAEACRLKEACVPLSVQERESNVLTPTSIERAVQKLSEYGYCVLSGFVDAGLCRKWGDAVVADFDAAADRLLRRADRSVDLYRPLDSKNEPEAYRELSCREDLRADVRDGPALRKLVRESSSSSSSSNDCMVLKHPQLLEIVARAMNPPPEDPSLRKGNIGRYNFVQVENINTSNDADSFGSKVAFGKMGGIVSLPGAGDQAIHSDTPHLFESACCHLPPHYVNAFTPGRASEDDVGQTALVHGSHVLRVAARLLKDDDRADSDHDKLWWSQLVRPRLEPGDVILFDCRILHFGLANLSSHAKRPVIYANMTQPWFQDPKNWENERPIFEDGDYGAAGNK